MFGFCLDVAFACAEAHKLQMKQRQLILDNLTPEGCAAFLEEEEKRRAEAIAERRHRELCASIERAGKNACFW